MEQDKKMGVVDHEDVVDLEFMLKDKNTVDFNKGLSPEEKKDRRIDAGINYGIVKAGNVAAYNFSAGNSVKTTTAGKSFSSPPARVLDSDSFAKSAFTFDAESIVARSAVIEDDSSISTLYSIESIMQNKVSYGSINKDGDKPEEMGTSKGKDQDERVDSEDNPPEEVKATENKAKEKEAEETVESEREGEDMAIIFQETLNILEGQDKETFMHMEDNVKMKYIEYLKQVSEQEQDSNTEEEE